MTSEIPLSRGLVAVVDDEDYGRLVSIGPWHAHRSGRNFYASRSAWVNGRCRTIRMHNLITGQPYIDHVNGNGLDNRRVNLRQATHIQNMRNRRTGSNNTSGFKGVGLHRGRWQARIWVAGSMKSLGLFATPEMAARAYDAAAVELFGEFARLNLPDRITP